MDGGNKINSKRNYFIWLPRSRMRVWFVARVCVSSSSVALALMLLYFYFILLFTKFVHALANDSTKFHREHLHSYTFFHFLFAKHLKHIFVDISIAYAIIVLPLLFSVILNDDLLNAVEQQKQKRANLSWCIYLRTLNRTEKCVSVILLHITYSIVHSYRLQKYSVLMSSFTFSNETFDWLQCKYIFRTVGVNKIILNENIFHCVVMCAHLFISKFLFHLTRFVC